jgi:uncharacterized Zn-binding protein involved in type VI secretion
MPKVIRLGDTSDHGGAVITASSDYKSEGIFVARVSDLFDCPLHGVNPIAEGSPKHLNNGKRVARHGDHTQCGAALIASVQKHVID